MCFRMVEMYFTKCVFIDNVERCNKDLHESG